MYRGTSAITLDSKNRITIPTRYREELFADCQGKMVCTVDIQHPCLLLYPLPEWEEIELKLCGLSSMNPQERLLQQVLLGNASDCEIDKSGRLLINGPLRQHAGLEKGLMLVGQLRKFEIWSENAWQDQMQQGIAKIQSGEIELTDRLLDLSL
ncbi:MULTISPECIES: division/cell wall cluster transcriptional repressor MraZ [unclassified Colwellia]|jgi:MraZ protein|uniref:division/cell wall cluster transcriptional repressor MraZ n=1 Tax=unclassified Colwellia TaxID=196834 RepID=UPI000D398F9E|nr:MULTISPECIES: division/cell wall cluster transcriptional repressor MraZ [unclassified Colwellia]AWB58945.1 cell division/cell wall cluster transcriptional repressor MraZ [Colwellia sp. Arc7-D]MBA6414447.1 division/cell wall cluster transcriptional repressor MraZ [Colwellia sp. 6M3]|tara:strand:+ start:1311 stop:1769 length:459 start_codon:yes stop_codon:yes gene_type:complete